MALPIANLDDLTFDQLVSEARSLIPRNFPAWTDHNPSDPGIALLELFAFLIEATVYQVNRVPERSLERFAGLVGETRQGIEPIEALLRRALAGLETRYRAITEREFELLAKEADGRVARVNARAEVEDTPNVFPDEQTVKIIIVPHVPHEPAPVPTDELRQAVFDFLRSRCLITTRVRVVPPDYADIRLAVTVVRDRASRLPAESVREAVEHAVRTFLRPLTGGADGAGWEFGRPVFRSELYQVIEGVAGVDHVRQLLLKDSETAGELPLSPTSLVRLTDLSVTVKDI